MSRPKPNIPEPNPSGLCMCGCGKPTPIAKRTVGSKGMLRGKPIRFISGHNRTKYGPAVDEHPDVNPSGLCHCGCGERTTVNKSTRKLNRFIDGHNRRKSPILYIEEDRGYSTPCWTWQKGKSGKGYGIVYTKKGGEGAHRAMYKSIKGPIPDGLELDHLCRNTDCVNPSHLEPVTHLENVRRGCRHRGLDQYTEPSE